jgi:hypothetical protein
VALDFDLDLGVLFADCGASAVYTPAATGEPVSAVVVVDTPDETLAIGPGGGVRASRRRVHVRVSDVATAGKGDVIVVGGETLTANRAHRDDSGAVWLVECKI